ncbi:magnesium-transporting ATPase (P-type) [Cytobacillus eiseniae]|uniref:Magnesium-transporting ATPase (P-type) n=1 Tax=Cytobacillus eiseniae TaxID=762947 RepID=A0ABS4RHF6_9BACI|nr:hypothetical protein [Cytobacillus eiseniae]MBP2241754.1 magnesium-transporting ATPase (P-type) [Cytobacillus eiseniae]
MFSSVKDAFGLYKRNILRVLLIGITIFLPIQILYTILVNYISMPFYYFNIPLWPSFFQSVFMLMSVFIMLIPIISMAAQDIKMKKVKTGKLYIDTVKYAFFVYLISIPVSIFTSIGFLLLIVPGIILLIFLLGIPFVKVIEDESFKMVIKKSVLFGKENFLVICGFLLLFAAVDFVVTYALSFLAIVFTGQMAITNWVIMVFNMLFLPLFIFTMTKQYLNWNGEADVIHEEEYMKQLEQYS